MPCQSGQKQGVVESGSGFGVVGKERGWDGQIA